MKQNITKSQFMDAFKDAGRENQFSYEGLSALYDYLVEYEEDTGKEIDLDVIALCCDFTEYTMDDYLNDIGTDLEREDYEDDEEFNTAIKEEIQEKTQFIEIDEDRFIIQNF